MTSSSQSPGQPAAFRVHPVIIARVRQAPESVYGRPRATPCQERRPSTCSYVQQLGMKRRRVSQRRLSYGERAGVQPDPPPLEAPAQLHINDLPAALLLEASCKP